MEDENHMIFDIIMPKMGESITEGTILEWKKNVGDKINKDETLLEISTDKVDSEIPSSAEGFLLEILYNVNDVVKVGEIIAKISSDKLSNIDISNKEEVIKTITKIEWDSETTKKGGYPHYMLKEIYEQPKTINTVLKLDSSSLDEIVDMIHKSENVYFAGVGTTFYVAKFSKYLFSFLWFVKMNF